MKHFIYYIVGLLAITSNVYAAKDCPSLTFVFGEKKKKAQEILKKIDEIKKELSDSRLNLARRIKILSTYVTLGEQKVRPYLEWKHFNVANDLITEFKVVVGYMESNQWKKITESQLRGLEDKVVQTNKIAVLCNYAQVIRQQIPIIRQETLSIGLKEAIQRDPVNVNILSRMIENLKKVDFTQVVDKKTDEKTAEKTKDSKIVDEIMTGLSILEKQIPTDLQPIHQSLTIIVNLAPRFNKALKIASTKGPSTESEKMLFNEIKMFFKEEPRKLQEKITTKDAQILTLKTDLLSLITKLQKEIPTKR